MKSISDIKKECEAIDPLDEGAVQCFIQEYVSDERSGVASLVKKLCFENAANALKGVRI